MPTVLSVENTVNAHVLWGRVDQQPGPLGKQSGSTLTLSDPINPSRGNHSKYKNVSMHKDIYYSILVDKEKV